MDIICFTLLLIPPPPKGGTTRVSLKIYLSALTERRVMCYIPQRVIIMGTIGNIGIMQRRNDMSLPNPQLVEIDRILSGVPMFHYHLHDETEYFFDSFDSTKVICLGTHARKKNAVAVFGVWEGPEDSKPRIPPEAISMCAHMFLLRSATDKEVAEHGGKKAVIHLEVKQVIYFFGTLYAKTIVFCPKSSIGFYNPIV